MAKKKSNTTSEVAHVITSNDLNIDQKVDFNPASFSQYIRVLRQNWRQGTVACKGRSDVSFSNKKPWKQKGTGRARAGSPRSPLWRKGGVIFGPQPRTRELFISKGLKSSVNAGLLWNYLENQKVMSLSFDLADKPKTSLAYKALVDAGLNGKKVTLFVDKNDFVIHDSFNNIKDLSMLIFDQANAYHLANSEYWIVLNKDLDKFKEMVSSWI